MSRRIYIAIEIMSRELHAKVLLACIAAEQGYSAVIGDSAEMRDAIRTWKPGTVVWKGLVKKGQKNYRLFHAFGHNVVAQCEEGLVYPSPKFYTKLRVSEEALSELDIFFAWGKNQAEDILSKVPQQEAKIVLAGNPRIDLLDRRFRGVFDREVEQITEKYAPYLLVNTNFSSFTHTIGPEAVIQRLKAKGTINTSDDEAFYRGRSENRERLFHEYIKMLEALNSGIDDCSIILRPHPSEDISLWQDSVSHLKSVHVIRDGSAMPWIIGSKLMIHNDCTTAIEATILGKDVISFRPTADNPYESKLAVSLGTSTESIEELISAVKNILKRKGDYQPDISPQSIKFLKRYINSVDGEIASEVIVNKIDKLNCSQDALRMSDLLRRMRTAVRRYRYKLTRLIDSRKNKPGKVSVLSAVEVKEIIDQLNAHSGKFGNLVIQPVRGTSSCYRITKQ